MSLGTNWTVPFIQHYNIQMIIDCFRSSTGRHDIYSIVDAVLLDSILIQHAVAVSIHCNSPVQSVTAIETSFIHSAVLFTVKPGTTHYPHVTWAHATFYVLFSTPSLFLPMRWLSYADLYNLVIWCHIKMSVGALFNKYFLHFWKQLIIMLKSTRHVRHVSRNVCDNRNLRGILAREPTRIPLHITWRKQSDRSVSVRQNSKLKYPKCTRNITWAHVTWG
jgi:hypothetical protein